MPARGAVALLPPFIFMSVATVMYVSQRRLCAFLPRNCRGIVVEFLDRGSGANVVGIGI